MKHSTMRGVCKRLRPIGLILLATLACSASASGPYPFAFVSDRSGAQEIWMGRTDLAQPVQLTFSGGGKRLGAYSISPDGTSVVFAEPAAQVGDIWVLDLATNVRTQLTFDGSQNDNSMPSWSPDGERIVFQKRLGAFGGFGSQDYEIFSMKADGTDVQQHTSTPLRNVTASYSPNGQKIVFESDRDRGFNNFDIFITDATGFNQPAQNLTLFLGGANGRPSVSPDGKYVAFYNFTSPGPSNIWIVALDGSVAKQLTSGIACTERNTTWSPDGREVFFAAIAGGDEDVYAVDVATLAVRRVTFVGLYDTHPAFSQTPDLAAVTDAAVGRVHGRTNPGEWYVEVFVKGNGTTTVRGEVVVDGVHVYPFETEDVEIDEDWTPLNAAIFEAGPGQHSVEVRLLEPSATTVSTMTMLLTPFDPAIHGFGFPNLSIDLGARFDGVCAGMSQMSLALYRSSSPVPGLNFWTRLELIIRHLITQAANLDRYAAALAYPSDHLNWSTEYAAIRGSLAGYAPILLGLARPLTEGRGHMVVACGVIEVPNSVYDTSGSGRDLAQIWTYDPNAPGNRDSFVSAAFVGGWTPLAPLSSPRRIFWGRG